MKTISKKTLFFIAFTFYACSTLAQKNYKPGFTITLKGDTVRGLINDRNWEKNPNRIQFKTNSNSTTEYFTPADILGFGTYLNNNVESYTSAKVSIESSSDNIQFLDETPQFNTAEDHVFLLNLYKGSYELFLYMDGKEHYFVQNGSEITELKFKRYFSQEKSAILNVEQYKKQLMQLFNDCDKISIEEIDKTKYNSNELIKLFKKYDECKNLTQKEMTIKEKQNVIFGLLLGTDVANFRVNDKINITSFGNFNIGVSAAVILPRNNKTSSIIFEIVYRKYKFEKENADGINDYLPFKYHYFFNANYARLNVMYRYQWMLTKLKPFINVGFGNGFKLSKIDKSIARNTLSSTSTESAQPIFAEEKNLEQAANLGIGITIQKLSLELRGELTNGFSPYINLHNNVKSLSLNLNYRF